MDRADPGARVDALVAAVEVHLGSSPINRRDVVLVTGPWLAGVSGVVGALRKRLPDHTFVESPDLGICDAPMAVVFVVSAVAPLTESDYALLDAAADHTDVVVGVVSKIDVHRNWRAALTTNRDALIAHASRYGAVAWVGTAANPALGQPCVDDLVATIQGQLAGAGEVRRRNRLRAWEFRLRTIAQRFDCDAEDGGRRARVHALRAERIAALRESRLARSKRFIALRAQIQQVRIQLTYFARNCCSSARSQLRTDASRLSRRELAAFDAHTRGRIQEVIVEVGEATATHLAHIEKVMGVPVDLPPVGNLPTVAVGAPPLKSRDLETQLLMLLGAGFGLGVALTMTRVVADLAPGLTLAGIAAAVVIGLAITFWLVNTRILLYNRALLDRWASDATNSLRCGVEQLVARSVLAAEAVLTTALGECEEAENAQLVDRVNAIDSQMREHAHAAARAAALRDRELPKVQAALEAVRAELGEPGTRTA